MENRRLKIILNVNFVLILLLMILLLRFFMGLTTGNGIDPIIIVGSLAIITCLLYSLVFFVWNMVLYILVFFAKAVKAGYYRNAIIVLVAAVIVPYSLIAVFCLIGFIYG